MRHSCARAAAHRSERPDFRESCIRRVTLGGIKNHCPENERAKREYCTYLEHAKGRNAVTVDGVLAAIARFERHTKFRDFHTFRPEVAVAFKRALAAQADPGATDRLSLATIHTTLRSLQAFFHWLAGQPGYKSRLAYTDSEYFRLSDNEVRIATAESERPAPTLEQITRVLEVMPTGTPVERRNRALIAFAILTGARDGALASFRLKHVDLAEGVVSHDARDGVKSKRRKSFKTWFFPVGANAAQIVSDWIEYLRTGLLWGPEDPLFPRTAIVQGTSFAFTVGGLAREGWASANPVRQVFREAFATAGLPYFHPHTFRRTLALLGERVCKTPEEFKVWSQNLGHDSVLTTFLSYGSVPSRRHADVMRSLGQPRTPDDEATRLGRAVAEALRRAS